MRNLTAATLLAALIIVAGTAVVTRADAKIKLSSATYRAACAEAWQAVRYYRNKTAVHRLKLAATKLPPVEQNASCHRLRDRAVYWRTNARNHAKVVRYHYDWPSWLPANWQQLGACETGYGRRPGNFRHANSRFVSAFGISRSIYDRDAAHMGAPPWNDRRIPTPRQQYLAALGHLDLWGDGWTCPGP